MEEIRRLLADAEAQSPFSLNRGRNIDAYLEKLAEKAEVLLWLQPSATAGFIAFYCNDPDRKVAFISMVVVDPGAGGQGIGAALVRQVLETARDRSFGRVELEVHRENRRAVRLYESFGFASVEEEGDFLKMAVRL
jgi:ribosomal-protein-alanine N-acetyltransferase